MADANFIFLNNVANCSWSSIARRVARDNPRKFGNKLSSAGERQGSLMLGI
jgi:hypothetical protein